MQLLLSSNTLACKQSPDIYISHPVRHTDCWKQVLQARATVNCAFSRAEPGQINLKQLLDSLGWDKINHCKHTEKCIIVGLQNPCNSLGIWVIETAADTEFFLGAPHICGVCMELESF